MCAQACPLSHRNHCTGCTWEGWWYCCLPQLNLTALRCKSLPDCSLPDLKTFFMLNLLL
jgi:hypothetical protein